MPMKLAKDYLTLQKENVYTCINLCFHVKKIKISEFLPLTECKIKSTYGLPELFSCVPSTAIELILLL